jgi:hypothetical protein
MDSICFNGNNFGHFVSPFDDISRYQQGQHLTRYAHYVNVYILNYEIEQVVSNGPLITPEAACGSGVFEPMMMEAPVSLKATCAAGRYSIDGS